MSNIKISFIDEIDPTIQSDIELYEGSIKVSIDYTDEDNHCATYLDVPTAIKFSKELRRLIAIAKEGLGE